MQNLPPSCRRPGNQVATGQRRESTQQECQATFSTGVSISGPIPIQVTNEAAQVLPANPSRVYLSIENLSLWPWRVMFNGTPKAGYGIMIPPGEERSWEGMAVPVGLVKVIVGIEFSFGALGPFFGNISEGQRA